MDKNKMIKVMNRSGNPVGYPVPDSPIGQERVFAVGEIKEISFDELEKLSWMSGGRTLLEDYLKIQDDEAISLILGNVEPEYHYSENDVKNLLNNGTLDQLMDCLDFGTEGVIDLVKQYAVDLEISDINKRQAITEKTGFNINKAIELKHMEQEEEKTSKEIKTRRTSIPVSSTEEAPKRRTATPVQDKYKVVNTK